LSIYNMLGQTVANLIDREMSPGTHTAEWVGRDQDGHEMPTGVYLYRLKAGDVVQSKKMMLLK
jgi:flagellar hook assembly protein FlgD